MIGPALFVATLAFLTIVQHEFVISIGWEPWSDPGGAWPSGLALGPYGWIMSLSFAVSGAFDGLRRRPPPRRPGRTEDRPGSSRHLWCGDGVHGLRDRPDHTRRPEERSWPFHDIAFVVFALSFLASLLFLWRRFTKDGAWRFHARHTLATGLVATICLFIPGVAYYLFIAVLLVWFHATAIRLWQITRVIHPATQT